MATTINFSDKSVSYRTFLQDLGATIVRMLHEEHDDKEYVSTRSAYKTFGRANVDRWRREGKITPHFRPGKTEYETAQLRYLQRTDGATPTSVR